MTYIFDLDGTLALTGHRQHILDNKDDPKRWDKFFEACVDDKPNIPVIDTLRALVEAGAEVLIWSGRSDAVMDETIGWLSKYVLPGSDDDEIWDRLKMRHANDFTPDEELKKRWLTEMRERGDEPVAVFDDRDKVVAMWREHGVACFQVAPGAF